MIEVAVRVEAHQLTKESMTLIDAPPCPNPNFLNTCAIRLSLALGGELSRTSPIFLVGEFLVMAEKVQTSQGVFEKSVPKLLALL